MKNLSILFEYQRFAPNDGLQARLDAVAAKYLAEGTPLEDDELDVAAAGEPYRKLRFGEGSDADIG